MFHHVPPTPPPLLAKRQLWGLPTTTTTTSALASGCTPFELPSNGVLSLGDSVVTLSANALFQPQCTGTANSGVSMVDGFQDPFYASTIPQTYVIASATVIAWILVVMLIVTPRTAFFGSSSAAPTFGNGRGIIGGAQGGNINMIGVGSRPWLQKVAALTVALSLTIATADTFRHARTQYYNGYANADALRTEVLGSLEIRITRVISDVFVWLAQVQTLIRLFPRHKEKVLIKWIGFALIIFDSTFSCLNSFLIGGAGKPRHFVDAIPALSYLFELALGLLYAAWVIYYSLSKRRYAYYHKKMRNICLIAFLSLIAVLTPVVFFVTDVSNQDIAGWGDYFRWVGAAAASVVVWEWVERIEALERDEKKDGILGREIFDGDEMLEVAPSEESVWAGGTRRRRGGRDGESRDGSEGGGAELGLGHWVARFKRKTSVAPETHFPLGRRAHSPTTTTTPEISPPTHAGNGHVVFTDPSTPGINSQSSQAPLLTGPTRPAPIASPISRTDTTSAGSTVYVVRYDDGPDAPQPVRRRHLQTGHAQSKQMAHDAKDNDEKQDDAEEEEEEEVKPNRNRNQSRWQGVSNAFKRKRVSPPAEVQQARAAAGEARLATPAHNYSRWDLKGRLGVLAAETSDKVRDKQAARRRRAPDPVNLPTTVIPAPQRGGTRTWSPEHLVQAPATQRGDEAAARSAQLRAEDPSPLGAGGIWSPHSDVTTPAPLSPPQPQREPPPRASDLSPIDARTGGTVVVPAPRRRTSQSQEAASSQGRSQS
ncbi:pH-response regulator protein palH/RIM21 [Teratosphaeria destructans]|uniref:PH-response regulator protein palH/RIM21 n=1 Tax=Teratosphaeria destructans TaxID=418781 RepID=A0A9W7SSD6_9PEZI|nr:pH-response regulator protein palH/RIM21 [Teratosphaeria destructans]